ncbi:DUF1957 domain-containing protein [bacterium]|nr:DUF1957 domain-containing protein [bacterium]
MTEPDVSANNYFAVVLNAHSPYLKSASSKPAPEEYWFFAQILESYLPLLDVFERLNNENINTPVVLSLSPTLLELLNDKDLQERFLQYIDNKLQLIEKEAARCMFEHDISALLEHYRRETKYWRHKYTEVYKCNLIKAFADLHKAGALSLITTCASSAVLPLLSAEPELCRIQIETGLDTFNKYFGFRPADFWLPECAFIPGLEHLLHKAGIKYTHISVSSAIGAVPYIGGSTCRPFKSEDGLVFFPNDMSACVEVWSGSGYYTDFPYRCSSRDLSDDMPELDLSSFAPFTSERPAAGLKYHCSGLTDGSDIYRMQNALELAEYHAEAFINSRKRQFGQIPVSDACPPLLTLSLNAEFFGLNWYEGCKWLEKTLRLIDADPDLQLITPEAYAQKYAQSLPSAVPNSGAWLDGGFMSRWINYSNDWIFRSLGLAHKCFKRMAYAPEQTEEMQESINQALRFLLMVQAEDWPLMLSIGQHANYARKAVRNNLLAFYKLYEDFLNKKVDCQSLRSLHKRLNIFADLNYQKFFPPESRTDMDINNFNTDNNILQKLLQFKEVAGSVVELSNKPQQQDTWQKLANQIVTAVQITENIAAAAQETEALKIYKKSTAELKEILNAIKAADSPQQVFSCGQKASSVIGIWSEAAIKVVQEQLNRKD